MPSEKTWMGVIDHFTYYLTPHHCFDIDADGALHCDMATWLAINPACWPWKKGELYCIERKRNDRS